MGGMDDSGAHCMEAMMQLYQALSPPPGSCSGSSNGGPPRPTSFKTGDTCTPCKDNEDAWACIADMSLPLPFEFSTCAGASSDGLCVQTFTRPFMSVFCPATCALPCPEKTGREGFPGGGLGEGGGVGETQALPEGLTCEEKVAHDAGGMGVQKGNNHTFVARLAAVFDNPNATVEHLLPLVNVTNVIDYLAVTVALAQ